MQQDGTSEKDLQVKQGTALKQNEPLKPNITIQRNVSSKLNAAIERDDPSKQDSASEQGEQFMHEIERIFTVKLSEVLLFFFLIRSCLSSKARILFFQRIHLTNT